MPKPKVQEPVSIVLRYAPLTPDPTIPTLAVMMPVGDAEHDPNVELAATMVRYVTTLYAKQSFVHEAAMRLFGTCFVAAGAMTDHIRPVHAECAPLGVEYLVDMEYDYSISRVGDKVVGTPTVILTAYKPCTTEVVAGDGKETVLAWPNAIGDAPEDMVAGTLKLTVTHGMILVLEATGWLGGDNVKAHLREKYNAAVA